DRLFPHRKVDIDSFEIVLAGPANFDVILRAWRCDALVLRDLRTHWKYSLPVKPLANSVAASLCEAPRAQPARMGASPKGRRLQFETGGELFTLFQQRLRHNAAERVEKRLVLGEFFLPFLVIDS